MTQLFPEIGDTRLTWVEIELVPSDTRNKKAMVILNHGFLITIIINS